MNPSPAPAVAETPAYRNPGLPVAPRVADLLGRMTLEEKVAQLYSVHLDAGELCNPDGSFSAEKARQLLPHGASHLGRPGLKRSPRATAELTNAIQRYLVEETRLGIPALFSDEALHGLMAQGATSFPQAIGLASTWDPDLLERVFSAAGHEARARGSNYVFTPVLDLAREPRWGRTEETYGEDPHLVTRLGVAAIRGLQGRETNIDDQHVLATAKHFAAHGQPEGGTNAAPANFSERILREQFLPPFQAAVMEAGVGSVMASYNEIDGIPVHANRWLLGQVLREEWGFQGLLTSDGMGINDLLRLHHVVETPEEAARLALETGIEVELGDASLYPGLVAQVEAGLVDISLVDAAVSRVLRAKFLLGLFDRPYVDPEHAEQINNCTAHRALALEAAHKAIILLKNEGNLLPLDPANLGSMAVIGPNAATVHMGGYSGDPGRKISILDGIRAKVGDRVRVEYAEGCRITENHTGCYEAWIEDPVILSDPAEDAARIAEAARVAAGCDLAVVVLGDTESTCREAWSPEHPGDRDSLDLPARQNDLVEALLATGVPLVVVLINGRPATINRIAETVPAILEGWYLGQETGTAVADVLFGEVNPGGKLPITFPRSIGQLPVYYYQKPSGKRGYLFSSTAPLFPFGHGLSYTTFAYGNLRVEPARIPPDGRATVRVEVTNTGDRAGDEVVQLYIRDQVCSVTRPVLELKGFRRIGLQPGETQTVAFELGPEALSFLDGKMQRVVEPGRFDVLVGGSSARLDGTILEVSPAP